MNIKDRVGKVLDALSDKSINIILVASLVLVSVVVFLCVALQRCGGDPAEPLVEGRSLVPPSVSQPDASSSDASPSDWIPGLAAFTVTVSGADGNYIREIDMPDAEGQALRLAIFGQDENGFDFLMTAGTQSLTGSGEFVDSDQAVFVDQSEEIISFLFTDEGIVVEYSVPGAPAELSGADGIAGIYIREE